MPQIGELEGDEVTFVCVSDLAFTSKIAWAEKGRILRRKRSSRCIPPIRLTKPAA